jgi:hypothetical protein
MRIPSRADFYLLLCVLVPPRILLPSFPLLWLFFFFYISWSSSFFVSFSFLISFLQLVVFVHLLFALLFLSSFPSLLFLLSSSLNDLHPSNHVTVAWRKLQTGGEVGPMLNVADSASPYADPRFIVSLTQEGVINTIWNNVKYSPVT